MEGANVVYIREEYGLPIKMEHYRNDELVVDRSVCSIVY